LEDGTGGSGTLERGHHRGLNRTFGSRYSSWPFCPHDCSITTEPPPTTNCPNVQLSPTTDRHQLSQRPTVPTTNGHRRPTVIDDQLSPTSHQRPTVINDQPSSTTDCPQRPTVQHSTSVIIGSCTCMGGVPACVCYRRGGWEEGRRGGRGQSGHGWVMSRVEPPFSFRSLHTSHTSPAFRIGIDADEGVTREGMLFDKRKGGVDATGGTRVYWMMRGEMSLCTQHLGYCQVLSPPTNNLSCMSHTDMQPPSSPMYNGRW